jgi:hypothetical protein
MWFKESNLIGSKTVMAEGRFIYNRENGRDVVSLLRKWNAN